MYGFVPPSALSAAAFALSTACGSRLSRETILHHPKINLEVFKPQTVERSAPVMPAWVNRPERGAVSRVGFVGQSFAATLDAGKAQAVRDLLAAVSNRS